MPVGRDYVLFVVNIFQIPISSQIDNRNRLPRSASFELLSTIWVLERVFRLKSKGY